MSISYSQLHLYLRCPRQYEYACVKKLPRPISPGESFGSSVHNTLKQWGETEIKNQQAGTSEKQQLFAEQPASDVTSLTADFLLSLWHQNFIVDTYPTRVAADFDRQRGEALLRHFYDWWQRGSHSVLAVEKGFKLPADGTDISGRFDRVEAVADGLRVIDFKTGSVRDQDAVDADLQLSVYALAAAEAFGRPCAELVLLFLDEEGITELRTTRNQGQLQDALKQIRLLNERIATQDFHPTPSLEKCSACPYRRICDASAAR